ncbi:hypothetical protein F8251_09060, partial [Lactobacillus crispatus]
IECSESILTSIDVFVVINILSNRSKWTFYFLSSVQFNFTIGQNNHYNLYCHLTVSTIEKDGQLRPPFLIF